MSVNVTICMQSNFNMEMEKLYGFYLHVFKLKVYALLCVLSRPLRPRSAAYKEDDCAKNLTIKHHPTWLLIVCH